jgi:carboxylesterase type B
MSAGGVSVNALNLSPRACGLFNQALIISGGGDSLFSPSISQPPQPIDLEGPAPMRRPAFEMGREEAPGMDGTFIAQLPSQALMEGCSNARRIMVGYSSFEGSLLDSLAIPPDLIVQALDGQGLYPNADEYDLYGELIFRRPANQLAMLAASGPAEVWLFDYGYVPEAQRGHSRGAAHGAALYALMETLDPAYSELACAPTRP